MYSLTTATEVSGRSLEEKVNSKTLKKGFNAENKKIDKLVHSN
jgi:hypothetical protein